MIIENFRPGVMKRLGLDYASVKNNNPRLVYLSLPGFASTDKERSHIQAWEGVLSAAAAVYTETSWWRDKFNYPPVYSSVPQCSAYGGIHGVIAVMAALLARIQNGVGTTFEVPLVDAGLSGFSTHFVLDRTYTLRSQSNPNQKLPENFEPLIYNSQDNEALQNEKHKKAMAATMPPPFMGFYRCADNRKITVFCLDIAGQQEILLRNLDLYEALQQQGLLNEGPLKFGLSNNISNFEELDSEHKQKITERMSELFLTKPAAHWEKLLPAVSVVRTREEWLAEETMFKSGVNTTMNDGKSVLTVPGRVADVAGPGNSLMDVHPTEPEWIETPEAMDLFVSNYNNAKPVTLSIVAKGTVPLKKVNC